MKNFEIENLDYLKLVELENISGGGFWKDLGFLFGRGYDTHDYKGGEWSAWG